MPCSVVLNGIPRDCDANVGGLKAIYLTNLDDVSEIKLSTTGGQIESITMVEGKKFKGFFFKPGQASAVYTPRYNDAGEYSGEDGVTSVNFGRMDTTKRAQMGAISVAELVEIDVDNNGNAWLKGYDHPVLRTGGEANSGAALGDRNNMALELTSRDHQLPYLVPSTVLTGIID